jgi:hypothetical protein
LFQSNIAGSEAGAIFIDAFTGSILFNDSIFLLNTAQNNGGAIKIQYPVADIDFISCLFKQN